MSNKIKKYKRVEAISKDVDQTLEDKILEDLILNDKTLAAQILGDLRTASLVGDSINVVTASKRDIIDKIIRKYFGSFKYDEFANANVKPKPGSAMAPSKVLNIQENNQQVILDFLKNHASHLTPAQRKQLMKSIEGKMQSGTLEVDSFESLKNLIESGQSPRLMPGFARGILEYIRGDAAIKKYLQSSEAMLQGVINLGTGNPVTLYDVLYNPGIRINVVSGTNIDDSIKIALSGLDPLLKNKAQALQIQSFIGKAVLGIIATKAVGLPMIGASQVKGPSAAEKKALLSDSSSPFTEDKSSSSADQGEKASEETGTAAPDFIRGTMKDGSFVPDADQKPRSLPDSGITNGNIGNLGGQFSNQDNGSQLDRYYTNQQNKMLTNPSSQPPGITRQNHAQGAVRTAANDVNGMQRLFETQLPDLDAVLRQLQAFINNGEIQKAKNYVLSLQRQYGSLINEIQSIFEKKEER